MPDNFIDSEFFKWVVLPLLIFFARMADVTLGTLRNVFISKGLRNIVPFIGFFEVLIWLVSIRQIMQHLDNPLCYFGFAGGFAMGTYVGLWIERRLALGTQVIRIILPDKEETLVQALRQAGFGTTVIDGEGSKGPVKMIFTIFKRKDLGLVRELIERHEPTAFYSIEDIRIARQGVFPASEGGISSKIDYIRNIFPDIKVK
ncbi:MAG: hypothetical protein RL021_1715 [Bacteroidota bacterium]|jgi:uncharacterized protein YebE (UPF0316 family)